ncbi:MAG: hypothetical protein JKY31_02410 [Rhodobacteraceae bacterium]|nr:hypothetical protein [Paracoccaceae bacterium]
MNKAVEKTVETLRSRNWIEDCSTDIPDLATAFDVQDAAVLKIATDRGGFAGYKIAFNSDVLMKKLGVPHPGMGRIFADQVCESGVSLSVDDYVHFMIEPEIAAVLSKDIIPGVFHTAESVEMTVEKYLPAFELLDRRNKNGMMHPPTVIAHNVFNAGIVVGGPGLAPADFNWTTCKTVCRDSGKTVIEGTGIAPQNPAEALAFLANHFTGRGQIMRAGSLVLLGAHCPLYLVEAGREMTLDLGPLGGVSFST